MFQWFNFRKDSHSLQPDSLLRIVCLNINEIKRAIHNDIDADNAVRIICKNLRDSVDHSRCS